VIARQVSLVIVLLISAAALVPAQEPQERVSPAQLTAAIDNLGTLDFATRMNAARTVRRVPPAQAVPALIEAVTGHADGYVRFRALVLLAGFNDGRTKSVVLPLIADPNDRVRATAYTWFEHNTAPEAIPRLLAALDKEESEFVRPALMRALAAHGDDPRVRPVMKGLVNRGQDLFRSVAIEALGDYKGAYASPELTRVAQLDGPLQADAILALGKIGDKRALDTFAALQRTAPRDVQPSIAAAICLLGVNCQTHQSYLADTVAFAVKNSGFQELLRPAVGGLAAIASQGGEGTLQTLIDLGGPSQDPARAPIALGVGTVALRNPSLVLRVAGRQADLAPLIGLLRDAFDMLEEDYAEELFFTTVRRAYWQASEGTPERKAAGTLIQKLEF
jgi:HEAT repeat protein